MDEPSYIDEIDVVKVGHKAFYAFLRFTHQTSIHLHPLDVDHFAVVKEGSGWAIRIVPKGCGALQSRNVYLTEDAAWATVENISREVDNLERIIRSLPCGGRD